MKNGRSCKDQGGEILRQEKAGYILGMSEDWDGSREEKEHILHAINPTIKRRY